jgi:hypothetical protein
MSRFLTDTERPTRDRLPFTPVEFYKEEFLKHRWMLELQREYYSERAITGVESALDRVLTHLEELCQTGNADRVVSRLLRKFDALTGLSAWSDPKQVN